MAAKAKGKPLIKVEEIEEPQIESSDASANAEAGVKKSVLGGGEGEVSPTETSKSLEENQPAEGEEKPSILEPPKVTSFSQLDTPPSPLTKTSKVSQPAFQSETVGKGKEESPRLEGEEKKSADAIGTETSSEQVKEWLSEVRPDTTKDVAKTNGPNFKIIFLIAFGLLVLGVFLGGFFYYRRSATKTETPLEPVAATSTPTPTPTLAQIEVDLKSLNVNVLNGSGVTGEAGRVKSLLVNEGFAEDKVKTGNADSSDNEKSSVQLKKEVPESVFNSIKERLGKTYDVVKSEQPLKSDSTYDIVIIVGAKKSS